MAGGYYSIVRWMKIGFMPCVSGLWTSETYIPRLFISAKSGSGPFRVW